MALHPYRSDDDTTLALCHCGEPAVLTCESCGAPFCLEHLMLNGRCADCEVESANKRDVARILRHGVAIVVTAGAAIATYSYTDALVAITTAPLAYAFVLTAAFAHRRLRGWLEARSTPDTEVTLAEVPIAAATQADRELPARARTREPNRMLGSVANKTMRGTWGS